MAVITGSVVTYVHPAFRYKYAAAVIFYTGPIGRQYLSQIGSQSGGASRALDPLKPPYSPMLRRKEHDLILSSNILQSNE